jgi:hypothetical protein
MEIQIQAQERGFRPLRLEALLLLLPIAWWARRQLVDHWRKMSLVIALYAGCSTFPALLGYPTSHTICDSLVSSGMLLYLVIAWCVAVVLIGTSAMVVDQRRTVSAIG